MTLPARRPAVLPAGRLSFESVVGLLNTAVALGLAYHLVVELVSARDLTATDFTVFRTGWELILRGRASDLYDPVSQGEVQRALLHQVGSNGFQDGLMAFLHPPHAALAGCLLGWVAERFGTPAAFWLWTSCSIAFLMRLARLVRDELGGGPRLTALVIVTLAAFYPVLETLQQGQVSALLGLAALACVVALRQGRPLAAAAWLLVLSIKPQTLPAIVVVLAVRRQWRVLAYAVVLGAGTVLVTTLVLGGHVWWEYLTRLPSLERFFGAGTPDHMPTIRGGLTRLLGSDSHATIDLVALVVWAGALAAAGAAAARTRQQADVRAPLAFALAAGALASPHLFPQDVLLWVAPVTLVLSLTRDAGDEPLWCRRARIVLSWPLWFVLARALDIRETPRPRMTVDLMIVPLALATAWAVREVVRAGPSALARRPARAHGAGDEE